MGDKEFLQWIYGRLTEVHGENKSVDYMQKLRGVINNISDKDSGIFVVVAENDQTHQIGGKPFYDEKGPIVFEQYTNNASLVEIERRALDLSRKYGKCRIAKLVFIDE